MLEEVRKSKQLKEAANRLAVGSTLRLSGVWGSSRALVAATLAQLTGRTVLYLATHLEDADNVADDIEVLSGKPAELFPAWEVDIGMDHLNDEVAGERLRVCSALASVGNVAEKAPATAPNAPSLIVTPIMALLQPVPSREALDSGKLTLTRGMSSDPEQLAAWLIDAGFEHVEQVDQQGQFARRGGIVDLLPMGVTQAVRIEFFGDEIESIRRFDLDTQRSTDEIAAFDVTGMSAARQTQSGRATSLLHYLPADTIIVMPEPREVWELAGELYRRVEASRAGSHDGLTGGILSLRDPDELFLQLGKYAICELAPFAAGSGGGAEANLGIRSLERLAVNVGDALAELTQLAQVAKVMVFCENQAEESRFREMLQADHPKLAERMATATGHVNVGFHWPALKLVVVGHHEIFHRYAKVRRIRRVRAGRPIESLLDLAEGDYVVHVTHGIARFEGLRTLDREGRSEEYLRLKFADDAVLHVPAGSINLVQKYIGARGKRPALSHLGGTGWLRTKKKVEAAVTDMAAELLRVQAMRGAMEGIVYQRQTPWQRQFEDEFLYEETEDQISAIRQIDEDMAQPRPMDRLLCGDVGYGKTEMAMRAAFKVAEAGKQVAVLVPTTVLADQHFRTFSERFADYPMRVDVLSRFRKGAEVTRVLQDLAAGEIDILIGTHRMLSKDVRFADLGLAVIDEEQRFGVEHKERLKTLRATVDVLTMTATPIPRTLHMSLLGLRDISSLTTAPMDRRAIHTEVRHYDDDFVRQAINRELNRQGQVFFVHNRVMDIESLAGRIRELAPDARVDIGHGQMPEGQLEKVMLRLTRGEIDVFVCTTIIESGLDIATANTIIIHNADRFGLAELHQLRGRVGRYKHRAYCYLLLPEDRTVTSVASKRLKAIEEFSDLGAGFQIAMRDLEIRGAGNILGPEQSGHIAAVGYELYCQLLEKAVRQMRGQPEPAHRDVHVELGVDELIPKSYVPSERQRMEVYRRLVRCHAEDELKTLQSDLADAYGQPPRQVQTLLDLAEIRLRAGMLGVTSIIRMQPDIIFSIRDFSLAKRLFDGASGTVRLPDDKTVHWRLPPTFHQPRTLLTVILNRLRQAMGVGKATV